MIDSPCNDICTTDQENGLCIGCGRTQEEIANWLFYTNEQKKKVLKALESRNKISTSQNSMLNNQYK